MNQFVMKRRNKEKQQHWKKITAKLQCRLESWLPGAGGKTGRDELQWTVFRFPESCLTKNPLVRKTATNDRTNGLTL